MSECPKANKKHVSLLGEVTVEVLGASPPEVGISTLLSWRLLFCFLLFGVMFEQEKNIFSQACGSTPEAKVGIPHPPKFQLYLAFACPLF